MENIYKKMKLNEQAEKKLILTKNSVDAEPYIK